MVSRLENRAKPKPSPKPAPPDADPALFFLAPFLRTHRRKILAQWTREMQRLTVSDELSFVRRQPAVLESILTQLLALSEANPPASWGSIGGRDRLLPSIPPHSPPLPDFLQVFFTCADSLRSLLVKSPEFKRLADASRKAVLRQVEMAFTILIHREIHALSENCNRLQGGCDFADIVRHTAFSEISLSPRAQTA